MHSKVCKVGIGFLVVYEISYPEGGGEATNAGREMDDIATRVIDDTPLEQTTATPQGECTDSVGESEPQRDEHHPSNEVHAPEQGTRQQDQTDGRKDKLEVDHCR